MIIIYNNYWKTKDPTHSKTSKLPRLVARSPFPDASHGWRKLAGKICQHPELADSSHPCPGVAFHRWLLVAEETWMEPWRFLMFFGWGTAVRRSSWFVITCDGDGDNDAAAPAAADDDDGDGIMLDIRSHIGTSLKLLSQMHIQAQVETIHGNLNFEPPKKNERCGCL